VKSYIKRPDIPILTMSLESAELCKYASNSFLAAKISFTNEIASIAERNPHVNIDDVMQAVIADHRICPSHMKPGLGFGGSCLPKDLTGLASYSEESGLSTPLLHAIDMVNRDTITRLVALFQSSVGSLSGIKSAILGLAFKAGTDDARSSLSIDLIQALKELKSQVFVQDPVVGVEQLDPEVCESVTICNSVDECVEDAEVVFIMTDWPMYIEMGLEGITKGMKSKTVVDGRRMFAHAEIPDEIFYIALGSYSEKMPP
jgi:UDPglucose 6-dehydrogenase